jgi:hypothetical protein
MEVEAKNTREALEQIDVPHTLSNELMALAGLEPLLDANDDEQLADIAALVGPIRAEIDREAGQLQDEIEAIAYQVMPTFRAHLEAKVAARKAAEGAGEG